MAEYDAFTKFRELDERLEDIFDILESKSRRCEPKTYPDHFPALTLEQALKQIEQLKTLVELQKRRADEAEEKVDKLKARILEKELEDLKTESTKSNQDTKTLLTALRRRFGIKYHPDKIGANGIMGQINRALDFLENPEHRHL